MTLAINGNWNYFAMQVGDECRVGMNFPRYPKALESDCNHACPDDPNSKCGGDLYNSVYKLNKHYASDYTIEISTASESLKLPLDISIICGPKVI